MAGRVMARATSEGEVGRHGVAGDDEEKQQRSTGVRKGVELTGGPHMAVMCEREGISVGVRKVEENTPFGKYANAAWAEWAERGAGGLQGGAGQRGAGQGRMGQNLKKIPF
jgi:hypothetical protein